MTCLAEYYSSTIIFLKCLWWCVGELSASNHCLVRLLMSKTIHLLPKIIIRCINDSLSSLESSMAHRSKCQFLWVLVNSWGTNISTSFSFPVAFKCWWTNVRDVLCSLKSFWQMLSVLLEEMLSINKFFYYYFLLFPFQGSSPEQLFWNNLF